MTTPNQPTLKPINPTLTAKGRHNGVHPLLDLLQESIGDDGIYYPPQHISLYGNSAITALRDFCNDLLSTPQPHE